MQWTPKICFIETRKNINKLTTRNLGNLNKCITFDGPLHLSSMKNIGHIVKRIIRNASNDIAEHIAEVCYENRKVKNMQLHWKVVENYTPYFLFCSYLKMEIYKKNTNSKNIKAPEVDKFLSLDDANNETVQVNLRNNFNLRNDIDFIYDTSSRNSTLKFKNLICLNCEKVTIPEKFIKIKNDWIFKYYNKRIEINKVDHDASIDSIEKENELKVKISSNLVEDHWNEDMKLPLYFRKMYKIDRFNKKDEILFFTDTKFKKYKESLICIDCYLNIVRFVQGNKKHGTNIYDKGYEEKDTKKFGIKERIKMVKEVLDKRRRIVTKKKLLKKEEELEKDLFENKPRFFGKKKSFEKKKKRKLRKRLTRMKSVSNARISSTKLPDMKSDKFSISRLQSGKRMRDRSKTKIVRGRSGILKPRKVMTFRNKSSANLNAKKKKRPMTAALAPKKRKFLDDSGQKNQIELISEEKSGDSESLDLTEFEEKKKKRKKKKFGIKKMLKNRRVSNGAKEQMKTVDGRIRSSKVFKKGYRLDDYLVF